MQPTIAARSFLIFERPKEIISIVSINNISTQGGGLWNSTYTMYFSGNDPKRMIQHAVNLEGSRRMRDHQCFTGKYFQDT